MDQFTGANAVLDDQGATMMDRRCVNDPTTDARTVGSLAGLLNPVTEISAQFRSGMMKSGLGYDRFFRDQTVIKHTTGTFSAGGSVNGGVRYKLHRGNLALNYLFIFNYNIFEAEFVLNYFRNFFFRIFLLVHHQK